MQLHSSKHARKVAATVPQPYCRPSLDPTGLRFRRASTMSRFPQGTRIRKEFETGYFNGTIDAYDEVEGSYFYHITYDDGDEEHLSGVEELVEEYQAYERGQKKNIPSKRSRDEHNGKEDDSKDDNKRAAKKTRSRESNAEEEFADADEDDSESAEETEVDENVGSRKSPRLSLSKARERQPPARKARSNKLLKSVNTRIDDFFAPRKGGSSRSPVSIEDNDHDPDNESPTSATRSRKPIEARSMAGKSDENISSRKEGEVKEDTSKVKTQRRSFKPATKSSKRKRKSYGDDSDDAEASDWSEPPESSNSEDEAVMATMAQDLKELQSQETLTDPSDEEEKVPKKKSPVRRRKKKPVPKAKKASERKRDSGGPKKKMSESFQPINAPTYPKLSLDEIKRTKDYLDPCGMEATDDIIDGIIGKQLDKIGGLLARTLRGNALGTSKNPIRLGTACSGTDAPALALTLVQEQWALRQQAVSMHHEHVFSCENEPFKQAYLARNFDSKLYPDIGKLVDSSQENYVPTDVYGKAEALPSCNLFVAGTSCKNFSMLRSRYRIDIEDKGCSGETFLAAVEVLMQEKPETAIFENVLNAPWEKMSEYITGRVKLSSCSSSKAIKHIKDKNKELMFCFDAKLKHIIVEQVPSVYGVRCGSVVKGVSKPDTPGVVESLSWPKGSNKTCSLSDLIRHNSVDRAKDTLVFETECTYCTQTVTVDSKEFGLPQTRQRVYMFVWRPEGGKIDDDLGKYWVQLVKELKSPVQHSLDSFLLEDDHDTVRIFREALNGPPGRQSKRSFFMEPDFWTSTSANLPHNKNTRKALGLKDKARWLINWGPFGQKQIPLSFWLEYWNVCDQRVLDMLEILYAAAIRDAESHDPLYSNYFWNMSQNASKEKHRTACPGIASCITPGGDFFVPHRGRPLLGCEKLLIQGLPYFRLLLGNETEVQLSDLAGNAMSVSVVCATMLAALTCKQLQSESRKGLTLPSAICKSEITKDAEVTTYSKDETDNGSSCSIDDFLRKLLDIADELVSTSVWCTCETSGKFSDTECFLRCQVCRASCCRNCVSQVAGYNVSCHKMKEQNIQRSRHGVTMMRLRQIAPSQMQLSSKTEGIDNVTNDIDSLLGQTFSLHRIKSDRQKWVLIYYARSRSGSHAKLGELKISVGELCRSPGAAVGVQCDVTSFQPAMSNPATFGPLQSSAKFSLVSGQSEAAVWSTRRASSSISARVEGFEQEDCLRVEVGLEEGIEDELVNAVFSRKDFKEASSRGESERWVYPERWQHWPKKVVVSLAGNLDGEYYRISCRQTSNLSAIWSREGEEAMFIISLPTASRTAPDRFVFSSSMSCKDFSAVVAKLPEFWQPSHCFLDESKAVVLERQDWLPCSSLACSILPPKLSVTSPAWHQGDLICVSGLDSADLVDFKTYSSESNEVVVHEGEGAQKNLRLFNSLCSAPIQKLLADSKTGPLDLCATSSWRSLCPNGTAIGHCVITCPTPPGEEWYFDKERVSWRRKSDLEGSRLFYKALLAAPKVFQFFADAQTNGLKVRCNALAAGHRVAHNLIWGRGDCVWNGKVGVEYMLSDTNQQPDPQIKPFVISNSKKEETTDVTLKSPYSLYERQAKVVTKMLAVENRNADLTELELYETDMPGDVCLSMVAKATRQTSIRGGVIADAIGAGKTVISIAIMLQGLVKARASARAPRQSGASLVVVPPALIDQWESEIQKFTDASLNFKIVKIYDSATLSKTTVQTLLHADVVICPIDILESNKYLHNLLALARMSVNAVPKLPPYAGQSEPTGARGVWIPATSTDPYAGTNNPLNQQRRDQSAYYTYVYQQAIEKVRQQDFSLHKKGVPLEYFCWERIFVDEVHETLCTTKADMAVSKAQHNDKDKAFYKEKNRRAGRELLGLVKRDISKRPLVYRRAIFGLTGTPLLDGTSRVVELANLMGGTYVTGLSSHWRKLERESCRDIFLHHYLEPRPSRLVRQSVYDHCQGYLNLACCRNKGGEEMAGIQLKEHVYKVKMHAEEVQEYLNGQSGIPMDKRSLSITPNDFDPLVSDIGQFLRTNAQLACRGQALRDIVSEIQKKDPTTKIIVFCDGRLGAATAAAAVDCTTLQSTDSIAERNRKISWYQRGDATTEDRARPRVLLLHFADAAGLNLQTEAYHIILWTPLFTDSAVTDASTELQAIGRVYRAGQTHPVVHLYRIQVTGPEDEDCLDGYLIRRNTNKETVAMAINAGDD